MNLIIAFFFFHFLKCCSSEILLSTRQHVTPYTSHVPFEVPILPLFKSHWIFLNEKSHWKI